MPACCFVQSNRLRQCVTLTVVLRQCSEEMGPVQQWQDRSVARSLPHSEVLREAEDTHAWLTRGHGVACEACEEGGRRQQMSVRRADGYSYMPEVGTGPALEMTATSPVHVRSADC